MLNVHEMLVSSRSAGVESTESVRAGGDMIPCLVRGIVDECKACIWSYGELKETVWYLKLLHICNVPYSVCYIPCLITGR